MAAEAAAEEAAAKGTTPATTEEGTATGDTTERIAEGVRVTWSLPPDACGCDPFEMIGPCLEHAQCTQCLGAHTGRSCNDKHTPCPLDCPGRIIRLYQAWFVDDFNADAGSHRGVTVRLARHRAVVRFLMMIWNEIKTKTINQEPTS